jgi:hypothetical protein
MRPRPQAPHSPQPNGITIRRPLLSELDSLNVTETGTNVNISVTAKKPPKETAEAVMPGLVPGMTASAAGAKDVDGRDRPGHDEYGELEMHPTPTNRPARQTRRV